MMFKLAIFDLDNTVLNQDKRLPKKTLQSIRKLKAQGVKITIATGRNFEMAKPFALELGAENLIACNNGGLLHDLKTGEILKEKLIEPDALIDAIDVAEKHAITYVIYTASGVHLPAHQTRFDVYHEWNRMFPESPLEISEVTDTNQLKALKAYKVLYVIDEPQLLDKMRDQLAKHPALSVTKSSDTYLDIMPVGTDKKNALEYFLATFNVKENEVIAFGDNDNDAELLNAIPFSFAMQNGTINAKEAASYITRLDANHAGVAEVLENLKSYLG